jgi:hypothetical protein
METTTTFSVGDRVKVLQSVRPVERVRGIGTILRITAGHAEPLYWIEGFPCARTARELRMAEEAR